MEVRGDDDDDVGRQVRQARSEAGNRAGAGGMLLDHQDAIKCRLRWADNNPCHRAVQCLEDVLEHRRVTDAELSLGPPSHAAAASTGEHDRVVPRRHLFRLATVLSQLPVWRF